MRTDLFHRRPRRSQRYQTLRTGHSESWFGTLTASGDILEQGNAEGSLAQKIAKVTKVLNFEDRSLGELVRDPDSFRRQLGARKCGRISCTEGHKGHKGRNFEGRSLGELAWDHGNFRRQLGARECEGSLAQKVAKTTKVPSSRTGHWESWLGT
jgi:hypothetical protein